MNIRCCFKKRHFLPYSLIKSASNLCMTNTTQKESQESRRTSSSSSLCASEIQSSCHQKHNATVERLAWRFADQVRNTTKPGQQAIHSFIIPKCAREAFFLECFRRRTRRNSVGVCLHEEGRGLSIQTFICRPTAKVVSTIQRFFRPTRPATTSLNVCIKFSSLTQLQERPTELPLCHDEL